LTTPIQYADKITARIIVSLFVIMLAGCFIYYKERMLFVDPSWIVFSILNEKHFIISEYRYGAFITQMIPLIAGYMHLPLKVILIAYSASFNAFYLCTILVLLFRYKQNALAILMAFYFTLFVSDEYFWPNNEVHQGVAWMFLFFGLFLHRSKDLRIHHHLLLLAFGFLAIFSHFIVIIPFSYLWIYYIIQYKSREIANKPIIFYTLYLSLIFIVKYRLGINGWYDGAKLTNVKKLNLSDIWYSFSNGQAKTMGTLLLSNYWIVILLILVGLIFAIKKKSYITVALTLAYSVGYFSVVCLTYPDAFGRNTLFYMESEWMALSIIATSLFVFKVLPQLKPGYIHIALILIFLVRITYIFSASQIFSQRVEIIGETVAALQKKNIHKAVIIKNPETEKDFLMDWGTPIESLFYSSMKGDKQITFKIMDQKDIQPIAADSFHSCFNRISYKKLNSYYFKNDSTQSYEVVSYDELKKED
jgi:hypothetical protein